MYVRVCALICEQMSDAWKIKSNDTALMWAPAKTQGVIPDQLLAGNWERMAARNELFVRKFGGPRDWQRFWWFHAFSRA